MVSNNEWEDFLVGNKHSPYARVQEANRAREGLAPISSQGGFAGGSGHSGMLGQYFNWVGEKVEGITDAVPPFKQIIRLCDWLGEKGWKWKLTLGLAGIMIGIWMADGTYYGNTFRSGVTRWLVRHFAPFHAWCGGIGGFLSGYFMLSFAGFVVSRALRFGIGLIIVSFTVSLVGAAYVVLALVFDWPLPSFPHS